MSEPFIGQIVAFGFNWAPRGWAQCKGQLLQISQNGALFSLLGTIYGGNGTSDFALPDLRGRSPIGYGTSPELSDYQIGERGGYETKQLVVAELPSHSHQITSTAIQATLRGLADEAETKSIAGSSLAQPGGTDIFSGEAPSAAMHPGSIEVTGGQPTCGPTGSSQPFSLLSPYLAINWCIALSGVFPPRS